jgi:GPH family glycoside/pentoside/hexuronide:cation symporter
MFAPPFGLSEKGLYVYVFVIALIYYTTYAIVFVPYLALGTELSMDYHERTRVQVWRSIFMFSPSLILPWTWRLTQLDMFPDERTGAVWVTAAFSLLMIFPLWLCFAGTKEEIGVQEQAGVTLWQAFKLTCTNLGFVLISLSYALFLFGLTVGLSVGYYVGIYYVFGGEANEKASQLQALGGMISVPASLVGSIFWGWLGTRIGKRLGYLAGLLSITVISPCSWFLFSPTWPYLQLTYSVLIGFAFGAMGVFPNSMVADLCDVDELECGRRREGAYNGIVSFMGKVGFSVTYFATGVILRLSGFNEKIAAQEPEVLTNLRLSMALVPLATMVIIVVLIWFYPLEEQRVREIRNVLEQRRRGARDGEPRGPILSS